MKLSVLDQKIKMNIQLGVICTDMVDFYRPAHILGMGDIEDFVYNYCEARISRLSQLLFPLYFC